MSSEFNYTIKTPSGKPYLTITNDTESQTFNIKLHGYDKLGDYRLHLDKKVIPELIRTLQLMVEPTTPPEPIFPLLKDVYNQCPTCGLKLNQVMSYSCPNSQCPTGLGPITC